MDTLQHLREMHEAARLKAETAELEATYKALETASRVVESEWGDIVDRREYLYDSPGFGSPLNSRATSAYDRNRGQFSPFFESEQDLAQIRGIARFCATSYETGINAIENLVSFVLGKGFMYKAISRGESDAPEALLKAVDKAIEEFHEANRWEGDLETEIVIRSDRDGECFAWMRDDGGPMVTLIEPDYITEPADCVKLNDLVDCPDADWFLGVGASAMHLDCPKGYFAQWPGGRVGMIPKSRMVHVKCNVDRMIKRGLSSFYPVWQTLEKAAKLTDRTIHGSTIQASIALIKKHMSGTSKEAIESGRTSRTIATSSYNTPSRYKTDYLEDYGKGGKIIGSAGFDYMYGPLGQSGAPAFMDVVGAAMRIVGSRWQMPEYMISGDASNANYASTLVSGGPFERATSRRQAFYRRHCLSIHWQALDVWCKAGRFRKLGINTLGELKNIIDIQVDCEPPAVNDPQVQHTINKDLQAAGVMSKATFADRNGLDYKAEQEKIDSEPKPEMPGMPGQGLPMDQQAFDPFAESLDPRDGDGDGLINDGKANEGPANGSSKKATGKKGKQTDSPEFKKWFEGSKVVDESGEPLVVYHGTTKTFDTFNTSRDAGEGNTSDPNAFIGAHFTASQETANRFAGELYGAKGEAQVKPVFLSIKKPLMVGQGRPPEKEMAAATAEYEKAKKAMDDHSIARLNDKAYKAKLDAAMQSGDDKAIDDALADPVGDELYKKQTAAHRTIMDLKDKHRPIKEVEIYKELGMSYDKVSAKMSQLKGRARVQYAARVGQEMRDRLEKKGYDGVFYENAYEEETGVGAGDKNRRTFIALNPSQIKSAIGNSGKFDPKNPKITEASRLHEAARLIWGGYPGGRPNADQAKQ